MDDEIKGEGNSVNYKYRMHDPRIGRFFAVDPLAAKYPYNSPYAFSENRVLDAVELEGLECVEVNECEKPSNTEYGSAEININLTVFEVNSGPNAIIQSDLINESAVEAAFDRGDNVLYMTQLPEIKEVEDEFGTNVAYIEGTLATSSQIRRFNKGKSDIPLWIVSVNYNVDYVKPSTPFTLSDFNDLQKEYSRQGYYYDRGIMAVAIPNETGVETNNQENESAKYFSDGPLQTYDISIYNNGFAWLPAQIYGSNPEKYSDHFEVRYAYKNVDGSIGRIYMTSSEVVVHSIGHLSSRMHIHHQPDQLYEYGQVGLQSSWKGDVFPTDDNTMNIINEMQNLWINK
jgi:hypothetical protein